ncbi:hypothetical protein GCM10011374_41440 [Kocuria dechangensis]|uniref:UspA domain-containing protein n=1 Tax=Kocuria dechangensis TaxID=1176249 RepID=A0A917HAC0_9MICC|nr:universal stress protein [Kocuria dechangensis]GGG72386.1 hypothetical protein GCM10011374_41440 [Kocuria dechangensis]
MTPQADEDVPFCTSPDRVVVAVDGGRASVAALRWAAAEAELRGAHLHVLHSVEPATQDPRSATEALLHRAFACLPADLESRSVAEGAAEALVVASDGAALLVVGTDERDAFAEVLDATAHRADGGPSCPVALVHEGQEPPHRERPHRPFRAHDIARRHQKRINTSML